MRALFFTSMLAVTAGLSGCGGEDAAPPPPPIARKKAAEPAAAPPPVATVDYAYNPVGKRDPFRASIDVGGPAVDDGNRVDTGCDDPLCKSNVDEFNVVAIVSGDANPLAMVEDRTGVGYVVRRNTRMGKAGGKVTQIRRDCVVVTSFVSGGADGKPQANKQEICLRTDARSKNPTNLLNGKEFIP